MSEERNEEVLSHSFSSKLDYSTLIWVFLALIGLALILICVSIPNISAEQFYVGGTGPGNYTTIQAAIDNTTDGDAVYISDGEY